MIGNLRKLEEKDAEFMLEWMHDKDVNCYFQASFENADKDSVLDFINSSFDENNQHFAFTDENDEYLGTISLKNISPKNRNAEYAVVTRKKAQGTAAAKAATENILRYAFNELKLHKVYLNVLETNKRAIRFYEKQGFMYEGTARDAVYIHGQYQNLLWYGVFSKS